MKIMQERFAPQYSNAVLKVAWILILLIVVAEMSAAQATSAGIQSKTASVDGLKIHYLTAGKGPAVILLHGYTQTSRMWRPLIPLLSAQLSLLMVAVLPYLRVRLAS